MNAMISQTLADLERFMAGRDDALAVPREGGALLHALVLLAKPRRIVEIGTSFGYSGLWMAAALQEPEARLVTIDRDPRKIEHARHVFDRAGLADRVELITGVALDVLPMVSGPIDMLFSDADKPNCIAYVEAVLPRLALRAIIVTDNTRTHAAELAPYMAWMSAHGDFFTTDLSIGNGMGVSIRHE